MIDYNKNNYVKIGNYSNVVNELDKAVLSDATRNLPSQIHDFILPLIDKLALAHPEWQFIGYDAIYRSYSDSFVVRRFRIYEGDEELGSVIYDSWGEDHFVITNKRIAASMRRRSAMKTKDAKKAFKLIEEYFYTNSITERVAEAYNVVGGAISSANWRTRRGYDNCVTQLSKAMVGYIVENMDTMRPILESKGAPSAVFDRLLEDYNSFVTVDTLAQARNANSGVTVLLKGDRYILMPDGNPGAYTEVTASQLRPDMSAKIAMLKLVDGEHTVVDSVGMRVNSNTFYVLA